MTRAQTSTEYLIISAVVIIIAVVVVGVLGGIPGIGGGTSANVNRAQLQILPVGIIEYHVGQDDTVVILRNNQQQNVVVTQILYGSQTCAVNRQITPGREIRVDCDNINSSLPLSDILVEYRVQEAIYYVSTSGSASTPPLEFEPVEPFIGWCYQESADSLVGSQENCTHLLSVGGAYAYEGDVNNPTNAWDEDWDTYANLVDPWYGGSTYLYFNYSAPDNIGSNTHFQFSMHLTTMNVTLNDYGCLGENPIQIQVNMYGHSMMMGTFGNIYCWDGDSWEQMHSISVMELTHMRFYEEAMWWYIDES